MYKKGRGFEKIKVIIKVLCVVKILNTFIQTHRRPYPNSKPSITKFRSTPSITYCCHYSDAMVFRTSQAISQSSPNEREIMFSANSPSSCVII